MATTAFNKVTHEWLVSETSLPTLTPTENWVLDPTFTDPTRCTEIGPNYWVLVSGTTIRPMTDDEMGLNSVPAYNKVTRQWISTATPGDLTPEEDWVINPVFTDFERCQQLGPKYWVFDPDGVTIRSMTDEEIDVNPECLAETLEAKRTEINDMRTAVFAAGFHDGNQVHWSTSPTDIANINAVCTLVAVGAVTDNQTWRDADNVDHTMSPAELIGLAAQMAVFGRTCYGVSWYHKANIEAMTTCSAIRAYDITSGWPT